MHFKKHIVYIDTNNTFKAVICIVVIKRLPMYFIFKNIKYKKKWKQFIQEKLKKN